MKQLREEAFEWLFDRLFMTVSERRLINIFWPVYDLDLNEIGLFSRRPALDAGSLLPLKCHKRNIYVCHFSCAAEETCSAQPSLMEFRCRNDILVKMTTLPVRRRLQQPTTTTPWELKPSAETNSDPTQGCPRRRSPDFLRCWCVRTVGISQDLCGFNEFVIQLSCNIFLFIWLFRLCYF